MHLPSLGDRVSNRPRVVFAAGRYTKQERADGLSLSPCHETTSLQVDLMGRDRFLIPFKANARHIGNVKQSVTNFIGLL